MPYQILEIDPVWSGSIANVETYLKVMGASDNISLRTFDTGNATHIVVNLPEGLDPGFRIIAGPYSKQQAQSYISTNW